MVQNNATLTITGNVTCYRGVTMTINSGSTLIIDGGTLKDVNLQLQSGASLIIQNGGQLKCNPAFPFTLPVGATLNQYNGTIR